LNDYLKSLEIDPINSVVYDNVAMCLFRLGDEDKAHEFIDKSIEINKQTNQRNDADMPMLRKAQFYESQNLKNKALEQYKKTLSVFPNSEWAKKKIIELSK